jgi:ABC-type Fe3+-citrate transport system substrate-binding protein
MRLKDPALLHNEEGDPMVEAMNAMERMEEMYEEGKKQLEEHKERMESVMKDLQAGKFPPGVGPAGKKPLPEEAM